MTTIAKAAATMRNATTVQLICTPLSALSGPYSGRHGMAVGLRLLRRAVPGPRAAGGGDVVEISRSAIQ